VPHLLPIPSDLAQMIGGVYSIEYGGTTPSSLEVEFRKP
jgi:hypothetical protein